MNYNNTTKDTYSDAVETLLTGLFPQDPKPTQYDREESKELLRKLGSGTERNNLALLKFWVASGEKIHPIDAVDMLRVMRTFNNDKDQEIEELLLEATRL